EAQLGNRDEAEKAYDKQIETDPQNPLALADRAVLAINVGDYAMAEACALAMMVRSEAKIQGEASHIMALCRYRRSKHDEAIEYFDSALSFGTQDPEQVKWNKSLALSAIGRYR